MLLNDATGTDECGDYYLVNGWINSSKQITLDADNRVHFNAVTPLKFATVEDANESISKHRKEWIVYLGLNEEES